MQHHSYRQANITSPEIKKRVKQLNRWLERSDLGCWEDDVEEAINKCL
jgi:hypothetical protein